MFKPLTIGYYKQVRNNPRCKAKVDLMPGMAVVLDEINKEAKLPAGDEVKGGLWIVSNIVDKPEIGNKADFVVKAGEYVRADLLEDAKELGIELDFRVIDTDYANIQVGDVLVANTNGKWEVATETDGYTITLEVVEKSNFGDKGIVAIVKVG